MISGSANRSGDCPREPSAQARRRRERDQWLRRRLLERRLHDGAAMRISAVTLRLGLLRHCVPTDCAPTDGQAIPDSPAIQDSIIELQDELHAVLEELREVAATIYPPLLDEAGLGPALREMADRLDLPVTIVASRERFGPAAEGAAYFAVAQCLAALRDGASPTEVVVRRDNDALLLSVCGVHARHAELMDDQVWPLGGTVEVVDGAGLDRPGDSTIIVRIPCE